MSLARVLSHLRTGDVIIVRDDASVRQRLSTMSGRPAVMGANAIDSRKLLRSLIAVRKDGDKK